MDNTQEISSFSGLDVVTEALSGKYMKKEDRFVNITVLKGVAFISVPTLNQAKTVSLKLPSHYATIAFVGKTDGTARAVSIPEDDNLSARLDSGESLFAVFHLKN